MSILILAPHPDDESIGCGGAVRTHVVDGERVVTVFLTSGEGGLDVSPQEARSIREAEALAAAAILGTAETAFLRLPDGHLTDLVAQAATALRPWLEREALDAIYLPHPDENHPDHQACLPIVREAIHASGIETPDLWLYEVWTPLTEHNHLIDITPVMAAKLRAIRCYRSQLDYFRYDRAARGLNQYRGALAGCCPYAEIFLWADVAE